MHSQQIVEFGGPLVAHDYPTPEPKGTEVLVRVHGCGVCHSDLHIWDGFFDLGGGNKIMVVERGMEMPFTLGHEIVGEVAALGPEAEGAALGDKRIVYPWVGCGECEICQRGDENLCATQRYLGTRAHGGYSDHVVVPHPRYLVAYDGVDDDIAGTYACSGLTAYASLKKVASLGADDNVVMIGAGGVGLNAVHLAPALIEAGVIVADTDEAKRQAALAAGARAAVDSAAKDAVKTVRTELTKGGAGAVIDFRGEPRLRPIRPRCAAQRRNPGHRRLVWGPIAPVPRPAPLPQPAHHGLVRRLPARPARPRGAGQRARRAAHPIRDAATFRGHPLPRGPQGRPRHGSCRAQALRPGGAVCAGTKFGI